jgi:3-oxoacyl-[acyl-carrier protein] reductase
MKFKNNVVVVSGGARDIGKAISLRLAAEGAKIEINYHDSEDKAKAILSESRNAGGQAIIVQGDMTKSADVNALIEKTLAEFGPKIDSLVNVVGGLAARKTIDEMDEDFFNQVMGLNLNLTFLTTKACTSHMPQGSSMVNFSSLAARDVGGPGASVYAASKAAVTTVTRAMAKELGPKDIRVNALCPGVISTLFHDSISKDEVRKNIANTTPLGREGAPDEVAYFASDESSFITGANIDINGGLFFS